MPQRPTQSPVIEAAIAQAIEALDKNKYTIISYAVHAFKVLY
jgi:hypothetical protein